MEEHVCPWWLGYALASPLRRIGQEPASILAPWVSQGMIVLEPGCGMGFFSIPLARLVGASGRVVCVDLQAKMLAGMERRARRAGLSNRIEARQCAADSLKVEDLDGTVDLALAFAVAHEVPNPDRFFGELHAALKPGGRLLLAEPTHVSAEQFDRTLQRAAACGFGPPAPVAIRRSRAVVMER